MSRSAKRLLALVISISGIGTIAVIDWCVGERFGLSIFYAAPVLFAAWRSGRGIGLMVAALAAAAWLLAKWLAAGGNVDCSAEIWAGAVRLGFFALLVFYQSFLDREKEHARTDVLTKLLNRRGFMERLGIELERARRSRCPVTLAYLDCDNFKEVNDRGGHRQGNAVLRRIGEVLQTRLRMVDVAGRLGGDEFSLIMPETERLQAQVALLRLHKDLHFATREIGWPVTFSIGAVSFETVPDSPEAALHAADTLMYEVKQAGRDALRVNAVT
jgi:diguanylate cyclase (GGDEF)-like protein